MEEAKTSGNLQWFKKMINSAASDSGSLHWYLIEYMNFLLHFPLPSISSHRHVLKVLKLRFILSPPLTHFSHILRTYTVFIRWKMASVSVKRATFREVVLRHRSDDGLKLETLALETRYGDQFTLLTQLIKPDYLVIPLYWRYTTVSYESNALYLLE